MGLGSFALYLSLQPVRLVVIEVGIESIVFHVLFSHVDLIVVIDLLLNVSSVFVHFDVLGVLPVGLFVRVFEHFLLVFAKKLV